MKLEKWALIAEIVGGVAIVFTLAVLIAETRQNTNATYASSYDQIAADMIELRTAIATDPQVRSDYLTFIGIEEGADPDLDYSQSGAIQISTAMYMLFERAYFAHEYGRLGDEEWARYERSICGNTTRRIFPTISRNPEGGYTAFTAEFIEFADECSK